MSDNRDTFVFYRSFKDCMSELSDTDKLIMYEAISDYSLDLKEPELIGFPKALFSLIRPILDANIQRWRNGNKGGAPKGNINNKGKKKLTESQPKVNQDTTESQANKDKDKEVNKDVDKDKSTNVDTKKTTRFLKPTIQQLQDFISEKKYSVNAETFFNYYEANGWKIGKNPMKDWKAAVRTWQSKESDNPRRKSSDIGIVLTDNNPDKYANDKLW